MHLSYKTRAEWVFARTSDWVEERPAKQKLTNSISAKGAKLYSVWARVDDNNRMKAELETWSVTSLRKFKKVQHWAKVEKVRDVMLFLTKDGSYGINKVRVPCLGDDGKEFLKEDYFSTPKKAVDYAIKRNAHEIKWLATRPPSTPETERMDQMFNLEKLALERLKKRLNK